MRLPEPYVFFVDRSLGGRVVAEGLRAVGEDVRVHDDLFAQDTDDEVWLADVGHRGWVVSGDVALMYEAHGPTTPPKRVK